jgi:hypothetical protein
MHPRVPLTLLLSTIGVLATTISPGTTKVEAEAARGPVAMLKEPAWGTCIEVDVFEFDASRPEQIVDGDWPAERSFVLTDLEAYCARLVAFDNAKRNVHARGFLFNPSGRPIHVSSVPSDRSPPALDDAIWESDRPLHCEFIPTTMPCGRINIQCRIEEPSGPQVRRTAVIPDGHSAVFLGDLTERNTYVGVMVTARLLRTEFEEP